MTCGRSSFLFADIDECSSPSTNFCNQGCNNTPGDYLCFCRKGYKLTANKRTCIGIHRLFFYASASSRLASIKLSLFTVVALETAFAFSAIREKGAHILAGFLQKIKRH